ncbi:MAG: PilZ domain-containing protein [Acidobacteriota bacterium]
MKYRRREKRSMCAQLVHVVYTDKDGRKRKTQAILEDISPGGACVQLEKAVSHDSSVSLLCPGGRYLGRVCYCHHRRDGYFLGIKFDPGYEWSHRQFKPEHLLRLSLRSEKDG